MDKKTIMMMKKTFDDIMHTTEDGSVEFWYARELMECLGYATWRRFKEAIERAKESCESAGIEVSNHFAGAGKMIDPISNFDDVLDSVLGSLEETFSPDGTAEKLKRINREIDTLSSRRKKLTDMYLDDKMEKMSIAVPYACIEGDIMRAKSSRRSRDIRNHGSL